jgi:flagellar protein FlaJ
MVYERVAAILPTRLLRWISEELEYVGMDIDEQRFAGFVMLFGIGLSAAIALNVYLILGLPFLSSFIVALFLFAGTTFFWINSVAESKGKFAERVLPDALQLIASNIKAGLTTERALFVSARPEFGPLSEELRQTSKRILSGERIETALLEIPKRIKSRILERTVWLIAQGIKSGGQIADLLIELSDDLREENSLRAEIKANISMYVMLIFFSAAVGAPLLFGISSHIVGVLSEQTATIGVTPEQIEEYSARSPALRIIGIPQVKITEEFIVFFAQMALIVTCLFAAMTLGVISTGSEKGGIRYLPLLLAIAFALFYIIRIVTEQFFGNMLFLF